MGQQRPHPQDAVDEIIDQWAVQRPELNVSALEVFGHQERAYSRYRSSLNHFFDRYGISVAMFDILVTLRRSAPPHRLTAGELATASLITSGGVTMRIDRAERAGLVVRERDDVDRRVVYSRLTTKGKDLIDRICDVHFARLEKILEIFSAQEREQLASLLAQLEGAIIATDTADDGDDGP